MGDERAAVLVEPFLLANPEPFGIVQMGMAVTLLPYVRPTRLTLLAPQNLTTFSSFR